MTMPAGLQTAAMVRSPQNPSHCHGRSAVSSFCPRPPCLSIADARAVNNSAVRLARICENCWLTGTPSLLSRYILHLLCLRCAPGLRGSGAAGSSQMLMGLPAAAAARPAAQEHPTRGELLLSVFMEFWMADGDCPLPGAPLPGGGSGPNTPNARSGRDGWRDFNDSWGGLLSARFSSLRSFSAPPSSFLILYSFDLITVIQ